MKKNKEIKNGTVQKNVTCVMAFFTPFSYLPHFVTFTVTLPLCYSLNFTKKLQNERKEDFFPYMAASAYHVIKKEVENQIFINTIEFLDTRVYRQPTYTKQWNYNNCVQILYSYFRHTGRLFLGCTLFVARCNIIRAL